MKQNKCRPWVRLALTALPVLGIACGMGLNAQRRMERGSSSMAQDEGAQWFTVSCASCHGLDGKGSGRAPSLVASTKVQRSSESRLMLTIQNGIPAAGMPAFRGVLEKPRIRAIVHYLRVLQGRRSAEPLAGDAQRGKVLFFGKGRCSECHAIQGVGGFIGPDLSQYAQFRSVDQVRTAIVEPGKNPDLQKMAAVTTQDGHTYTGVLRNEDNFSLQLQTLNGIFYLFMKAELTRLEYRSQSFMPSDYGSSLLASELDDLINFLIKTSHASGDATHNGQSRKRSHHGLKPARN